MKNTNKFFLFLLLSSLLVSCTKGDVFTGSPVGTNVSFVTLTGSITTPETNVVAGQTIPVTVTLPQTFAVDVKVQMTAFLPNTNRKTTKSVTVLAGQSTLITTMNMPGGDSSALPFDMTAQLYLSAITTGDNVTAPDGTIAPSGFAGYQYSLTSNIVTLDFGDSALAATNPDKCSIRFDFQFPPDGDVNYNNFKMILKDELNTTYNLSTNQNTLINGINGYLAYSQTNGYGSVNFSSATTDHTYTISVYPTHLYSSPVDVPYRFTVRYPDGTSKVLYDVFTGLTNPVNIPANAVAKLQIVKTTVSGVPTYAITQL